MKENIESNNYDDSDFTIFFILINIFNGIKIIDRHNIYQRIYTVFLAILAWMNTEVVFRLLYEFSVSRLQGDK